MAKKVVTLFIDDTGIRLLVASGRQVKKWADLPLEPGLVKSSVVIRETEVANRIKQFLKTHKVKTRKVVVGLSGLHCLTRPITLPQLPRTMLEEAVVREARRVLPVPLEQLYLSWQIIPSNNGKTQVFLVGVPCKTADTLIQTLRQAGLKPSLMGMKPLVLAELAKETTAVILDVQHTEFDIIIMADGVPQPIRTVPLPSETMSWQDELPLIRDDLERTIIFYNSNNPEKPITTSVPIFVAGEIADEVEACRSLSEALGHTVALLPQPFLAYPHQLDLPRYMTNIGLVLKELSPDKRAGLSRVYLNVLPAPYRPKPVSIFRVAALPVSAVLLMSTVFLMVLIQNASADIDTKRVKLNKADLLLQQRVTQKQKVTDTVIQIRKQLAQVEASRNAFNKAVVNLKTQSNRVHGELNTTVTSLINGVSITSMNYTNGGLTVNGKVSSQEALLEYIGALSSSKKYSEVIIISIRKTETGSLDFVVFLKGGGG
ncbi:MAG: pilus assembly protein PilM [Chloroflexi bacterium]|nr:pilus assembly protein PilM [Chloroflexota bacterium]